MSFDKVKQFFESQGAGEKVLWLEHSSATVELAAQAVGVEGARIAKTLSFKLENGCILILAAGDARIDNKKYKTFFGSKAKMLSFEEAECRIGHAVGGVCPFGVPESVPVYLDKSMQRFETIFPACGSSNSAIELDCDTLFQYARAKEWVDVCKGWQVEA